MSDKVYSCGACNRVTAFPGMGAIAILNGKSITYFLCSTCTAAAQKCPQEIVDRVEANLTLIGSRS